jgi:transposase
MRAVGPDTENLPDDPATLRALLAAALARCEALEGERAALEAQNDRLRHLLLKLKRLQFGRKSERLPG